jgi:hypothetical protein
MEIALAETHDPDIVCSRKWRCTPDCIPSHFIVVPRLTCVTACDVLLEQLYKEYIRARKAECAAPRHKAKEARAKRLEIRETEARDAKMRADQAALATRTRTDQAYLQGFQAHVKARMQARREARARVPACPSVSALGQ